MINFEQQIQDEIERYQGPHQSLIACAPHTYRLLTHLLDDPELPSRFRPLVLVMVAYFLLPVDIISEDISGPRGYLDDLFLFAVMAQTIQQETGSAELLERSWEGPGSFQTFVSDILSQEQDLIGDQREVILWYTGFEHLLTGIKTQD